MSYQAAASGVTTPPRCTVLRTAPSCGCPPLPAPCVDLALPADASPETVAGEAVRLSREAPRPVRWDGPLLGRPETARRFGETLLASRVSVRIWLAADPDEVLALPTAALALLAAAGVVGVALPTESGSDRWLAEQGRGHRVADAVRAGAWLAEHGIDACHRVVVGASGECRRDRLRTLALVRRLRGRQHVAFAFEDRGRPRARSRSLHLALACEARCPDRRPGARLVHVLAALRLRLGLFAWPIELRWVPREP